MTADSIFPAPWFWGFLLVAAALLVGFAGLGHPILVGDSATQLATIADTEGWRAIHWSICFGYVMAIAGLSGVAGVHAESRGAMLIRAGMCLVIFGYTTSAIGVLFMLGAAYGIAESYVEAVRAPAADAILLFDALHPFALAALRLGGFAISVGVCALGAGLTRGQLWRGWIGSLGMAAGATGAALTAVLPESSPAIAAGVGLATIWQLVLGALLLTRSEARLL